VSRRWLGLALLLSLGINGGILATLAVERLRTTPRDAASEAATPAAAPSPGLDGAASVGAGAEEPPPPDAEEPPPRSAAGPDFPPGMERRLGELATDMGLEGDRRAQFLDVQRRFFRATRPIHDRGLDLQRELRRELSAAQPSRERLTDILDRLESTRKELDNHLVETVLATRKLLGPEQERRYVQFLGRLRSVSEGGPGGRPPRDGPPPRRPPRRRPPRR
jgi:Spy/CpxP family protein refolding chaperone